MTLPETHAGFGPLLAQRSSWEHLGTRFSGEHREFQSTDLLWLVAAIALFAGGFWLLSRLAAWQAAGHKQPCPKRLLAELGARHQLSRSEMRLCREVAGELALEHPAEIFVRDTGRQALAVRNSALAERLFR